MRPRLDVPIRTSAVHLERILEASHPTLVAFEVSGCEPCRSLAVHLDDVAREFAGRALIVRVGDSAHGWVAARYDLSFVPTLLFYAEGREQARIQGNPGVEAIRAHLEFLLTAETRPAAASGPRHTLEARFDLSRPAAAARRPAGLLTGA